LYVEKSLGRMLLRVREQRDDEGEYLLRP